MAGIPPDEVKIPHSSERDSFESDPIEPSYTPEEAHVLEKSVWWKIDMYIIPIAMMFYLLSFFDRTNISNARVAGLQKDLKLTNHQYSVALTVTYVPYIAAELPSNLLQRTIGPNLMLPTMVMLWGLVTTLQGLVTTYHGLLAVRFFLGLLEGGLFPGLVLYLSYFYPRSRLNLRVSTFFSAASLSGAFSGLLAAGIEDMNGKAHKPGWAWIFILEGIFTFLFGLLSYFFLPRSPDTARFLNAQERSYVVSKLREDGTWSRERRGDDLSWIEIGRAFVSPQVLILTIPFFFSGATLYGLAYFEPTIVQGLGYAGNHAQLMSVPPFAVSFVVALLAAFVSDRYSCRGLVSAFASILMIIGFSMFYATNRNSVKYGSLFFSVTGVYVAAPTLSTWNANNSAPHVRRATAIAIAFIFTNSGGILATWLLGALSPAPKYTKATKTFIIMSVVQFAFILVNIGYLAVLNKKKAAIRTTATRDSEKPGLGDKSAWFEYNL